MSSGVIVPSECVVHTAVWCPLRHYFMIPGDPERFLCIHARITDRTVLIEID